MRILLLIYVTVMLFLSTLTLVQSISICGVSKPRSKEFTTEADLRLAFEDFLCATKGSLTASQIAKIRDTVGVVGMAGT